MRTCLAYALSFALAAPAALAQTPAAPTVAEARAFIDSANAELLKISTDDARAEWIADTDITEDTEATVALLDAQTTARTLAFTEESHRFDHLQLPPVLRRQIQLCR